MGWRATHRVVAIVGAIVPYPFFWRFPGTHGITGNFVAAGFANGASGGNIADLLLSSAVFRIHRFAEARRAGVGRPWVFVVLNLPIGPSCAVPLFLRARAQALERSARIAAGTTPAGG